MNTDSDTGPSSPLRRLFILLGLSAFAFTQPLLATFGESPESLVILQVDAIVMIAAVLMIAVVPTLIAWAAERVANLIDPRLGAAVEILTVALFAGLALSLVVERLLGFAWLGLVACLAAGGGLGYLVRRHRNLGDWLGFMAFGQLLFAGVFFFSSPAGSVMAGGSVSSPAGLESGLPVPVVLIVFDEFPTTTLMDGSGDIDGETFPGISELAARSTWYRNATTVAPNTTQAVPAILTGQLPPTNDTAPVAGEYPESVFTLLAGSHEMTSFEQITRICPSSACTTSTTASRWDAFTALVDLLPSTYRSIVTDQGGETLVVDAPFDTEAPARVDDFIEQLDAGPATLNVLHTLFPHAPFLYSGDGTRYDGPLVNRAAFDGVWLDDTSAVLARQRFQEQARVADDEVGRLIDRLVEADQFDDALVIVTADHGISFRGGEPNRGVAPDNQDDIAWVPLFVKYPGQTAGAVEDAPTRTTDIVPTIADVLEITPPWALDGTSLLDAPRPSDTPVVIADWFRSVLKPDDGHFLTLDGEAGFGEVVDARPINPEIEGPSGAFFPVPGGETMLGADFDALSIGPPIPETGIIEERYADLTWDGTEPAPFYVSGNIPRPPNEPVAIAVNGRIVAVVPTSIYNGFEETSWWSLLPADAITQGANDLELFLVEGDPAADPILRPVSLRPG